MSTRSRQKVREAAKDLVHRHGVPLAKQMWANARATGEMWTAEEDAPQWQPGSIWLGRVGQPVMGKAAGTDTDNHCLTIASSGSGKGVSSIIPNLLLWPGSLLVVDPKGENAYITARYRADRLGQKVVVLDPMRVSDVRGNLLGSFNPLDLIDVNADNAPTLARLIAETLITDEKEDHWLNSGRGYFSALILHVCETEPPEHRNLARVRKLLSLGRDQDLISRMAGSDLPAVYNSAMQIAATPEDECGSILSSAQQNTNWLDDPPMIRALSSSSFALDQLKQSTAGLSLYLCLPGDEMRIYAKWFRLMVRLALRAMLKGGQPATGHKTLFLLDEFHLLGHMPEMEQSFPLMRGYGVKLWPFVQDMSILRHHYPKSWPTFFANAGFVQVFGIGDYDTARSVSEWLGQYDATILSRSSGESMNAQAADSNKIDGPGWSSNVNFSTQQKDLLTPQALMQNFAAHTGRQLVLIQGGKPLELVRTPYFDDPAFPDWDPPAGRPGPKPPTHWQTAALAPAVPPTARQGSSLPMNLGGVAGAIGGVLARMTTAQKIIVIPLVIIFGIMAFGLVAGMMGPLLAVIMLAGVLAAFGFFVYLIFKMIRGFFRLFSRGGNQNS